jgi:hypothetical protein
MGKKIVRLSGQGVARRRIDRHEHRVRCEVSPRWIQFSHQIDRHGDQDYLRITIMTSDANERDRNLCELIVDPQELQTVLASVPIKDWRNV